MKGRRRKPALHSGAIRHGRRSDCLDRQSRKPFAERGAAAVQSATANVRRRRHPDPRNQGGPPGEGTGPTEPRLCCRPDPLTQRTWTHLVSCPVEFVLTGQDVRGSTADFDPASTRPRQKAFALVTTRHSTALAISWISQAPSASLKLATPPISSPQFPRSRCQRRLASRRALPLAVTMLS